MGFLFKHPKPLRLKKIRLLLLFRFSPLNLLTQPEIMADLFLMV